MRNPGAKWREFRRSKSKSSSAAHGHTIGLSAANSVQVIRQLKQGLPYTSLVRFQKESSLPLITIGRFVGIPPRTLMRRKVEGRLRTDESERLLRISRIFELTTSLFEGDTAATLSWLLKPRDEFAKESALEFAKTEIGARDVEDLIGQLEHGVFP